VDPVREVRIVLVSWRDADDTLAAIDSLAGARRRVAANGPRASLVVVDNGGYQIIRKLQMSTGSPSFGNELRFRNPKTGELDGPYIPIDFAANAASLGAVAMRATNESELREALQRARGETRTVVIHVPVQKHASVPGFDSWWDVPVAEVSEVATVREAREEYVEREKNERFFY